MKVSRGDIYWRNIYLCDLLQLFIRFLYLVENKIKCMCLQRPQVTLLITLSLPQCLTGTAPSLLCASLWPRRPLNRLGPPGFPGLHVLLRVKGSEAKFDLQTRLRRAL